MLIAQENQWSPGWQPSIDRMTDCGVWLDDPKHPKLNSRISRAEMLVYLDRFVRSCLEDSPEISSGGLDAIPITTSTTIATTTTMRSVPSTRTKSTEPPVRKSPTVSSTISTSLPGCTYQTQYPDGEVTGFGGGGVSPCDPEKTEIRIIPRPTCRPRTSFGRPSSALSFSIPGSTTSTLPWCN